MQSQFFDQQIGLWRWTGNQTHEALLRPALKLHVEWAQSCFDADNNGLFSSYINTWPTDSQFYSGGETWEETAYIYRAALALRDMALRAGNGTEAAVYGELAARISAAVPQLWVAAQGLPASHREAGGHRRLRPDPWLYSVFLPIDCGLWDAETVASALFFTEWGLERDALWCDPDPATTATCGAVVWTSNWVPSMWSLRQLWSGDNSALALAYFFAGLADDGYEVLSGTLRRDMLQSAVPGQSGGANGGVDFNDCVHPAARAIVEGLLGFRPDYALGTVTIAPQFPSDWRNATFSTADLALDFATDLSSTVALAVQLARPVPQLLVRLPLRARALQGVAVAGIPASAAVSNATEPGFGQTVLVVRITAAPGEALSAVNVTLAFAQPLPCVPSLVSGAVGGAPIALAAPEGLALASFSDPQAVFVPGSARVGADGRLTGTLAPGLTGWHLVHGLAATLGGGLPQALLFKLNVSAAAGGAAEGRAPPAAARGAAAAWSFVPLGSAANADLRDIFKEGLYLSPRPENCAARLGSDGWSAWTYRESLARPA